MPFTDLTSNIRHQIFQHLPRETLYSCTKVCKVWYTEASEVYYIDIDLKSGQQLFLRDTGRRRIDGKCIGDFVKHLKLYERKTVVYAPYTEYNQLAMHTTSYYNSSFTQLIECPNSKDFNYNASDFQHLLSRLPRLVSLRFDKPAKYLDYLAQIVPSFTITTLALENMSAADSNSILRLLYNLQNLKDLCITYDHHYIHTNKQGVQLGSVLDACKGLTSLELMAPPLDLIHYFKHEHLTRLKLTISQLSKHGVHYLIAELPSSLIQLELDITENPFLPDLDVETIVVLVNFLKQIKYFKMKVNLVTHLFDLSEAARIYKFTNQLGFNGRLVVTLRDYLGYDFMNESMKHGARVEVDSQNKTFDLNLCLPATTLMEDWFPFFQCLSALTDITIHDYGEPHQSIRRACFFLNERLSNPENRARLRKLFILQCRQVPMSSTKQVEMCLGINLSTRHLVAIGLHTLKPLNTISRLAPNIQHIHLSKCVFLPDANNCIKVNLDSYLALRSVKIDMTRLMKNGNWTRATVMVNSGGWPTSVIYNMNHPLVHTDAQIDVLFDVIIQRVGNISLGRKGQEEIIVMQHF